MSRVSLAARRRRHFAASIATLTVLAEGADLTEAASLQSLTLATHEPSHTIILHDLAPRRVEAFSHAARHAESSLLFGALPSPLPLRVAASKGVPRENSHAGEAGESVVFSPARKFLGFDEEVFEQSSSEAVVWVGELVKEMVGLGEGDD